MKISEFPVVKNSSVRIASVLYASVPHSSASSSPTGCHHHRLCEEPSLNGVYVIQYETMPRFPFAASRTLHYVIGSSYCPPIETIVQSVPACLLHLVLLL